MKIFNKNIILYKYSVAIVFVLLIVCALFALFSHTSYVYASSAQANLCFTQKLNLISGSSMDQVYDYKLVSLDSNNPMPEGSSADLYCFQLNGDTPINLTINYSHAGFYTYKVCMANTSEKQFYTYDKTVYLITVSVANTDNDGLKVSIIYKNDSSGLKVESPVWIISYDEQGPQPQPDPEPEPNSIANITKSLDLSYLLVMLAVIVLIVTLIVIRIDQKRSSNNQKTHQR